LLYILVLWSKGNGCIKRPVIQGSLLLRFCFEGVEQPHWIQRLGCGIPELVCFLSASSSGLFICRIRFDQHLPRAFWMRSRFLAVLNYSSNAVLLTADFLSCSEGVDRSGLCWSCMNQRIALCRSQNQIGYLA